MSTLTPNYGLHLPEDTDSMDDFFSNYGSDMETIDDHLGSGGGGNVYGAFIDTNRIITSGTYSSSDPLNYTATEDCFVDVVFISSDGTKEVKGYVDGVNIYRLLDSHSGTTEVYNQVIPLKKGQTLRVETSRTDSSSAYTVYGLTQGTNGIFTPIIYSDNERVVGVWRDNKPLYQRTFVLPTPIDVLYSSWTSMGVSVADGERIIRCEGIDNTDGLYNPLMAYFNNGVIECQTPRNNSNAWQIKYLSVWYTKTTDVAGSGNWNTDGVPTVHYSTSEQVIGTWIDGKPIYQCTWSGTKTTNAEEVVISGLVTLDTLVDSKVIFKGNTGAQIAQYFRDASDFGRCWFDSNGIHMDLGNSYPIRPVTWYITLSYTKTTD